MLDVAYPLFSVAVRPPEVVETDDSISFRHRRGDTLLCSSVSVRCRLKSNVAALVSGFSV